MLRWRDSLLEALKDCGVLAGKTGVGRNILTFMPPLTIEDHQIAMLLEVLAATINRCG